MTTDGVTIGDLALRSIIMSGSLPCAEVDRILAADPTLTSLVVRTATGNLGLVDRSEFEYRMSGASGFGRWLNASRPVETALDLSETLTLDATLSLDGAYRAMLGRSGPRRFHDILVLDGQQASTVRAGALLEAVARIHEREALRDALTGLGNRVLLTQRVAEALRDRFTDVALLFIDMDRFKVVNDSLGHDAGDSLLIQFAQRLRQCAGTDGIATRLGGDEFAVLITDPSETVAALIASKIVDALREPFTVGHQFVVMSASIGIALADGADTAAALLRKADLAMYQAKRSGGGRFQYFRGDLERVAHERLETEVWLRSALTASDALQVYYQPIVSLADNRMVGVEALVRGFSPTRGMLAPAEFLGVAEETGLITALDFWVLRAACAQLQRWQSRGGDAAALHVSVNMSARHFEHINMSHEVLSIARSAGITPSLLQLEITEGTMLHGMQQAATALQQLRDIGVRVAIDDFGTGYSSLNQLSKLPVDALKIDRSFVARSGASDQDAAIVRLIIALANAMDVAAVAEGIENHQQAQLLADLGCPQGQGYYFARPMPAAAIDSLLDAADAGHRLPARKESTALPRAA